MSGEFSKLTIRDGLTVRKGSRIIVSVNPRYSEELKVTRVYLHNDVIYVECMTKDGRGSTHPARNLAGYGILKKY